MDNRNKLSGEQIRVGEPIPADCYDGNGQLLLKKGLIVLSQRQVDYLLERGLYADIGPEITAGTPVAVELPPTPFQLLDNYQSRLTQIFSVLNATQDPPAANTEAQSFSERVGRLSSDIQKLCELDTDALLGSIHLDTSVRYTSTHPLHRAIVCEVVGSRKGLSKEDRSRLISAALTCDISMLKLQEELTRQATPLLPEQRAAIESHPLETVKLLSSLGVTDEQWLKAVLEHHEFLNGKGYPRHLQRNDLSDFAKILTLADIYTAMVSPRAYRKAHLSKVAMRTIFVKRGSEIDDELAVIIVKEFGVYPPGAFVKLHNGEVAIVIRRSENSKAPPVKAVVGPRGAPFSKPIPRNTALGEYEVNDVVERDPIVVIDFHQLWDYKTG